MSIADGFNWLLAAWTTACETETQRTSRSSATCIKSRSSGTETMACEHHIMPDYQPQVLPHRTYSRDDVSVTHQPSYHAVSYFY